MGVWLNGEAKVLSTIVIIPRLLPSFANSSRSVRILVGLHGVSQYKTWKTKQHQGQWLSMSFYVSETGNRWCKFSSETLLLCTCHGIMCVLSSGEGSEEERKQELRSKGRHKSLTGSRKEVRTYYFPRWRKLRVAGKNMQSFAVYNCPLSSWVGGYTQNGKNGKWGKSQNDSSRIGKLVGG